MNEDQIKGGFRAVKGTVEKGVGDVVDDRQWQADGVIDKIAGNTQNLYGHASETVQDTVDNASTLLASAGDKARSAAEQGRTVANEQIKQNPWVWVIAVGAIGYALSWAIHGQKD